MKLRKLVRALVPVMALISVGIVNAPAASAATMSDTGSATVSVTGITGSVNTVDSVDTATDPGAADPAAADTVGYDGYDPTTTTDPSTQTPCVKNPDGTLSCPDNSAGQIRYYGNSVCVTTNSSSTAWVDALYYDGTRTQLKWGKCATNNPMGFSVPNGWYCDSQWGYRYNGDWFGRAYYFSTSNNALRLTCFHA